ncbi:MAG: protein phosphatase 2C domain-containing protein [Bacteroidales bacterium]|nr:protein phosphatase 2C domain-containing protein [Bacteroidales bacterium]
MSLTTNTDHIFAKGVVGNVREVQEDSHDMALKTPNGDVFVVCDGMGGHVGGAKASSLAVESIISYLKKEEYPDPVAALNDALQFANMQVMGFAAANPDYKGMGTTACILLMRGCDVWIAHVGDSRIYLFLGKEKKLHRITKDHSFVQTLVDAGEITDEEAEHHAQKNRILKALGVSTTLQPSFNYENRPIRPKNGDVFLICTDGLSGMISDGTIENVLSQDCALEEKGEQLIRLAMEGETVQPGGQDNCTLELIQIDNSPWAKTACVSFNTPRRKRGKKASDMPQKLKYILITAIALALVLAVSIAWKPVTNRIKIKELQKDSLRIESELKTNGAELRKADSLKQVALEGLRDAEKKRDESLNKNKNTQDAAQNVVDGREDFYNEKKSEYEKIKSKQMSLLGEMEVIRENLQALRK